MIQQVIVYIILAVVFFLTARFIWRMVRPAKGHTAPGCAGCPISDSCTSAKPFYGCGTTAPTTKDKAN